MKTMPNCYRILLNPNFDSSELFAVQQMLFDIGYSWPARRTDKRLFLPYYHVLHGTILYAYPDSMKMYCSRIIQYELTEYVFMEPVFPLTVSDDLKTLCLLGFNIFESEHFKILEIEK